MNRNILTPDLLKKFRKALDAVTIGSALELQLLLTFRVVDAFVAAAEELVRREEIGENVTAENADLQSELDAMTANRDELAKEIKRLTSGPTRTQTDIRNVQCAAVWPKKMGILQSANWTPPSATGATHER